MKDIIPHLIKRGDQVNAYFTDGFWYDVGSVEKYEKLNENTVEKHFNFYDRRTPQDDLYDIYLDDPKLKTLEKRVWVQTR